MVSETQLTSDLGRIERFYRDEGARLWQALLGYAGDQDVASDALSEALTQALAREHEIRDAASWLWTASFRIAAGELKDQRRKVPFEDLGLTYEMSEPLPQVMKALASISPNQRLAVIMHDYADRPHR